MYVLVRSDLGPVTAAVQSCHAAIEAAASFDLKALPDHPHLVLLGFKNLSSLNKAVVQLQQNGIRFVSFYESDIGEELTAVATEPMHFDDPRRKVMRKYQLFKCREHGTLLDSGTEQQLKGVADEDVASRNDSGRPARCPQA